MKEISCNGELKTKVALYNRITGIRIPKEELKIFERCGNKGFGERQFQLLNVYHLFSKIDNTLHGVHGNTIFYFKVYICIYLLF